MSKIKIKVNVNDEKPSFYTAIYQEKEEILTYKEENNTLVKFNYKEDILTRENNEILMEYKFKKNEFSLGKIFIKELNQNLEISLKTKIFKKKNINLNIKYNVEDDNFSYVIEVIE